MNMKSMYYCLFAGLLLGSCSDNIYEVTDNGVVVKVQNPGNDNAKLIRLQVMGDKLRDSLMTKALLLFHKRKRYHSM